MQVKSKRFFLSRRARRHLLIGLSALLLIASLYILLGFSPERWVDIPDRKADMPLWRLSMALAYSALLFLSLTLAIGPYRVLRKQTIPANYMLRRDIALWAGGLALAHVSAAIWIHTDGWQLWGLFFWHLPGIEHPFSLRKDWFGFANLAGTAVMLVIVGLLLLSNNFALRRLGVRNWKNLQRSSYLAFLLVGLHGLAYQIVENRLAPLRIAFAAVVGIVAILQIWALVTRLAARQRHPITERRTA